MVDGYEVDTQRFLLEEAGNVHKIIKAARQAEKAGEGAVQPLIDKLEVVDRRGATRPFGERRLQCVEPALQSLRDLYTAPLDAGLVAGDRLLDGRSYLRLDRPPPAEDADRRYAGRAFPAAMVRWVASPKAERREPIAPHPRYVPNIRSFDEEGVDRDLVEVLGQRPAENDRGLRANCRRVSRSADCARRTTLSARRTPSSRTTYQPVPSAYRVLQSVLSRRAPLREKPLLLRRQKAFGLTGCCRSTENAAPAANSDKQPSRHAFQDPRHEIDAICAIATPAAAWSAARSPTVACE